MKVAFHREFKKQFDKLSAEQKSRVRERIKLFINDPFNAQLNNHSLKGKYLNYRSINITGDWRAIYKIFDQDRCVFVVLGTHSQLYK